MVDKKAEQRESDANRAGEGKRAAERRAIADAYRKMGEAKSFAQKLEERRKIHITKK